MQQQKQRNPLIGSDPEYMVIDRKTGRMSHAIDLTGGSKHNPLFVDGGAVQEDNVLLEINVNPTDDAEQFVHSFDKVLKQALALVEPQGVTICKTPSYNYDMEIIKDFPESAFVFGCDPDFNAYTGDPNPAPKLPEGYLGFRCAGGHVHIGWDHLANVDATTQMDVGQMCDLLLGVWGVSMGDDHQRRSLYGKAGAMRFKSYGMEYRTLGNFWVFKPELIREVHHRATLAYQSVGLLGTLHNVINVVDIQHCINTCDQRMASEILSEVNKHVSTR